MTPQPPTPQDYADLFEVNKTGQRILEQLIQRFSRPPKSSGIDRVLDTQEYMGQQNVLNFILLQINRANGVDDDQPTGDGNS
jgi:hypothetical protein